MSVTGGRSNATSRYRFGITADRLRAFARAMRCGRHRQSDAVLVASSTTNPDPSHVPYGQASLPRRGMTVIPPPGRRGGRCWHRGGRCSRREPLAGVVHELRELLLEAEDDFPDRAVAVLGDDDVRLARAFRVAVVVLLAIDEHHEVAVLLDLTRFPEVGQDRFLLPAALLDRAAELRERDHGSVQLAREALQSAGDLADLLDPALDAPLVAHQLEIVDDDQREAAVDLMVQSPSLGANVEHTGVARVIDP